MHGVGRIAGLHTAAHGRTGKQKVFFFFSFYRTSIKAQNIYTSKLIFLLLKNTRYTHIGSTYLTLKKEKEKRRRTCVLWFSFVVQMVQCEG